MTGKPNRVSLICQFAVLASLIFAGMAEAAEPHRIVIYDGSDGEGVSICVPLVELTTTNGIVHVTDNDGVIAITEPDLLGKEVYFHIKSHGYEFPADGFGFRGKKIFLKPGEETKINVKRINLAQRLYRTTGTGLRAEAILAVKARAAEGEWVIQPSSLSASEEVVAGSDSVMSVLYKNKHYWFWGDTNRLNYPLGNFHITGATTPQMPSYSYSQFPIYGHYRFFKDPEGFVKPMAKMPGEGPTWIGALAVLPDKDGQEKMVAYDVKVRPNMQAHRWGIVVWNDEKEEFERLKEFDAEPAYFKDIACHTFIERDPDTGNDYLYLAAPFPHIRVPATLEAYCDPTQYESYRPVDGWKKDITPLSQKQESAAIKDSKLSRENALRQMTDAATGKPVQVQNGSCHFNPYLNKYIMIFTELGGETSTLGEVWLSTSKDKVGPWTKAVKLLTHDHYSFYNPRYDYEFDQHDGRTIHFEGTYTHTFSQTTTPTPRYDYNNIMYRLDLNNLPETLK